MAPDPWWRWVRILLPWSRLWLQDCTWSSSFPRPAASYKTQPQAVGGTGFSFCNPPLMSKASLLSRKNKWFRDRTLDLCSGLDFLTILLICGLDPRPLHLWTPRILQCPVQSNYLVKFYWLHRIDKFFRLHSRMIVLVCTWFPTFGVFALWTFPCAIFVLIFQIHIL